MPPKSSYRDVADLYLLDQLQEVREADGGRLFRVHTVVRVVDPERTRAGKFSLAFNAATSTARFLHARIYPADGSAPRDLGAQAQVVTPFKEYAAYKDFSYLVLTNIALQKDDVIDYEVEVLTDAGLPTFYTTDWFINCREAISISDYRLVLADEQEYSIVHNNTVVRPEIYANGLKKVYLWSANYPEVVKSEPLMPSIYRVGGWLRVSEKRNWEQAATAYRTLLDPAMQPDPELTLHAHEISRDAQDNLARAQAIYYYLQKQIEYVNVELLSHHMAARNPLVTLGSGYGDSLDQAVLLAMLLRAQGMRADLAFIGRQSSRDISEQINADLTSFDHVMVLLKIGTRDYWLDTSTGFAPFGELLSNSYGQAAWVISEKNSYFTRTPDRVAEQSRRMLTARMEVMPTGALKVEMQVAFGGVRGILYRAGVANIAEQEHERSTMALLRNIFKQVELDPVKRVNMENLELSPGEHISFRAQPEGVVGPEGTLAVTPIFLSGLSSSYRGARLRPGRNYPLVLNRYLSSRDQILVVPPAGYQVESYPDNFEIKESFGSFKVTYQPDDDGNLEVLREYREETTELGVDRANIYFLFKEAIIAKDRQQVVLTKVDG